MKPQHLAVSALLLVAASTASADDYVFYVNTRVHYDYNASSPGWQLYDAAGQPTSYYGSWGNNVQSIDWDGDGSYDYDRIEVIFYGVTPGTYSIAVGLMDWNWTSYTFWTGLFDAASNNWNDLNYEAFSSTSPPGNNGPTRVAGDFDVAGNLFTFGSIATGEVAVRTEFLLGESRLDWGLTSRTAPNGYMPSLFSWSAPNPWSSTSMLPMMKLGSDSRLDLFNIYNPSPIISLNPNSATITINGSNVLTQSSGDGRYVQFNSSSLTLSSGLRVGSSATLSGSASLVGGAGAKVYGNNSLAFGANAIVGAPSASANNAFALGDGASATKVGAFAAGQGAKALNNQSIAIGRGAEANASTSLLWWAPGDFGPIAIGNQTKALGVGATALGQGNNALANYSLALGMISNVSAEAAGGMAIGLQANTIQSNGIAVGNSANALGNCSLSLGTGAYSSGDYSAAIGVCTEAVSLGQVVVGFAPALQTASTLEWDDMEAEVFVVGAGKPGNAANVANWRGYAVTQRTALSVKRGGELQAGGTVNSAAEGPGQYNKFKAPILVPASGDLSMGDFTAGQQP